MKRKLFFLVPALALCAVKVALCFAFVRDFVLLHLSALLLGREFRNVDLWCPRIQLICSLLLTLLIAVAFLFVTPLGKRVAEEIKFRFADFLAFIKEKRHAALIFSVVLALAFFKLFTIDYKYADDIRRSSTGATEWMWHECRYITQVLSQALHLSIYRLADVSLFMQLLAFTVVLVTMCAVLFVLHRNMSLINRGGGILSCALLILPKPLFCRKYQL